MTGDTVRVKHWMPYTLGCAWCRRGFLVVRGIQLWIPFTYGLFKSHGICDGCSEVQMGEVHKRKKVKQVAQDALQDKDLDAGTELAE